MQLTFPPNIIAFSETWLKPSTLDQEIGLQGFSIYRRDRSLDFDCPTRGGGVLVAVSHSISSSLVYCGTLSESVFVKISYGGKHILLGCIYLPPLSSLEVLSEFLLMLDQIASAATLDEIIICGDFNLPNIIWNTQPLDFSIVDYVSPSIKQNCLQLLNTCAYHGLQQQFPKHPTKNYSLDLLFSSSSFVKHLDCHDELVTSDQHHIAAFFSLNMLLNNTHYRTINNRLDFAKANFERIRECLHDVDWVEELSPYNVNTALDSFYKIVYDIIELYVPPAHVNTNQYPCWFSQELINHIILKKTAHWKWKHTGLFNQYIVFKILRAKCRRLSRGAYKKFLLQTESKITSDPKSFWSFVNKSKRDRSIPQVMHLNNAGVCEDRDIVNAFASFFSSAFNRTALNDLPPSNPGSILYSVSISAAELHEAFNSLSNNFNSGPDNIPISFYKELWENFAEPILLLFNKSLQSGVFPNLWKSAFITPVFKSGDRNNIANYRPISILCSLSKLFDLIICNKLTHFFRNVITEQQHGFLKGRSTISNLLVYTDYLFSAFKDGYQVDSIYLDLSKAFDTVCHTRLLQKLWNLGIRGTLYDWISSYITNRSQVVRALGHLSVSCDIPSGVPQGSHLGPLFFFCCTLMISVANFNLLIFYYTPMTSKSLIVSPAQEMPL